MNKIILPFLRVVCLGSLLLGLPPVSEAGPASPFSVVSTLDNPDVSPGNNVCADSNGNCTLRAAVMEANAHVGPDTILVPADTFHLTILGSPENQAATGDLDLTGQVTLQGAGAGVTIIDATGLNDRVIDVLAGAQASLSDLTIRRGIVPTSGVTAGGGLLNNGTLTLTRVSITDNNLGGAQGSRYGGGLFNLAPGWLALNNSQVTTNEAEIGGGISNDGVMAISGSQVLSNNSADNGGGIRNDGMLAVSGSQVVSNTSAANGGGIYNGNILAIDSSQVLSNTSALGAGGILNLGPLAISNSLIRGNQALGTGAGGGLLASAGSVTITTSTLSSNHSGGSGGGLLIVGSAVTVSSSTLSGNSTDADGGAVYMNNASGRLRLANVTLALNVAKGSGGAIVDNGGDIAVHNVTIADNSANAGITGGSGGGLYLASGSVALSNTLLVNNRRIFINFTQADDCAGAFGTFHYSLVGTSSGCSFANDHTLVGANPQLLPLAANGGPTLTQALGPGSAALDAGDPAGCASPAGGLLLTDQRGLPRHADGNRDGLARCDMGAYEVELQLFLSFVQR